MSVRDGAIESRHDVPEVLAAVDDIDGHPHLIIADTSRDSHWVAIPEEEALSLEDWR